jgi:hypothetical protein
MRILNTEADLTYIETDLFLLLMPGRVGSKAFFRKITGKDNKWIVTNKNQVDVSVINEKLDTLQNKIKIIVVREPLERYKSGIKVFEYTKQFVKDPNNFKAIKSMSSTANSINFLSSVQNWEVYRRHHGAPFIKYLDYNKIDYYIDFEDLYDYLGKNIEPKKTMDVNEDVDLHDEILAYENLKKTMVKLPVDIWEDLLHNSKMNNYDGEKYE